jgi:PST family polysaccharide transporter
MTLWLTPHLLWCIHGTVISPRDLLLAVQRPLLSVVVAAVLTYIVQSFYAESLTPLLRLIVGGGILLLVYLWMLLYVMGQKAFYLEILQSLRKRSSVGEKPDHLKVGTA